MIENVIFQNFIAIYKYKSLIGTKIGEVINPNNCGLKLSDVCYWLEFFTDKDNKDTIKNVLRNNCRFVKFKKEVICLP